MDYTPKGLYAKIEYSIYIAVMILSIPFVWTYYNLIKPLLNKFKER